MKALAIIGLIGLTFLAAAGQRAAGQSKSVGNTSSAGGSSKAALAEVREIVHVLEGDTEKLQELLSQHSALIDDKPQQDEQRTKWSAALDRLLVRIEAARAALVATVQRLDKAITGELPTGLAKDVARVRNEAEPARVNAEQVLSKNKPGKGTPAKAKAEKPAPENNEHYDL